MISQPFNGGGGGGGGGKWDMLWVSPKQTLNVISLCYCVLLCKETVYCLSHSAVFYTDPI